MAHEIEIVNNNASFMYVGSAPWHKLGRKFQEAPSIEEAIVAAGLDWKVGLRKLQTVETLENVEALATYRSSDNSILGVVGPSYRPLQNQEAFNFFKPFIDSKAASIETAGSLRNGKRVFVLCKINKDPLKVVGDDIVDKYILLSNSHDGTMAVRVGFTPIRVVCNNTLTAAVNSSSSKLLRVRHTKNTAEALEKVQEIMNLANSDFEATAEQYKFLASKQVNPEDLEKYVKLVFAEKQVSESTAISEVTAGSRVLEKITPIFENGIGMNIPGVKGTYWAAYNAVTEYVQHHRGNNDELRLDQAWFGTGAQINKKALQVATVLASK